LNVLRGQNRLVLGGSLHWIFHECDPQEVYCYEYNNHECCIAFDGDIEAIRLVAGIWGVETAKTIKRRSAFYRVEELFN